jgi:modulator of FtsH protease HflK
MSNSSHLSELANDLKIALHGARRMAWIAVGVLAMAWLASGLASIRGNEVGLVTRFGELVQEHHTPGLKYLLPWPIDRLERVPTTDVLSVRAGFATDVAAHHPAEDMGIPYCLTGDQNIIHISVTALYRIRNPRQYLYGVEQVDVLLRSVLNGVIIRTTAGIGVEAALTDQKAVFREQVIQQANATLDHLESGLLVTSVTINSITPPAATTAAFEAVNNAKVGVRKAESQADKHKKTVMSDAMGRAAAIRRRAEGDAYARIQRALGDVAQFNALHQEYKRAPSITRVRLYLQAMATILKKAKVHILTPANIDASRSVIPPANLSLPKP